MSPSFRRFPILVPCAMGIFAAHAIAQSSGGPYSVELSVVAGGGGSASGGALNVRGTFGQGASALLAAPGYQLHGGFWPALPASADSIFADGFES